MSRIAYSQILNSNSEKALTRSEQPGAYNDAALSGEISAAPEVQSINATLSRIAADGEVVYERDVPLWLRSGVRLPLRPPAEMRDNPEFSIYGILAEPANDSDLTLAKKWTVVVAAWPWSRGWSDYGEFKPPGDKGAKRVSRVWEAAVNSRGRWREYLKDEAKINLCSNQRDVWKAVLLDPQRVDDALIPGRDCSIPRPTKATNGKQIVPHLHWGLCEGLDACSDHLMNPEYTPQVHELIGATIDGTLLQKYYAGHGALERWTEGHEPDIHPTLQNTERATALMQHAIRLALAGPKSFAEFPMEPGRNGSPVRLVATQVRWIYLELALNFHKRAIEAEYGVRTERRGWRAALESRGTTPNAGNLAKTLEERVVEEINWLSTLSPAARREQLDLAIYALEFPSEIQWHVNEDNPAQEAIAQASDDNSVLIEAFIKIVALSRLGCFTDRVSDHLRELDKISALAEFVAWVRKELRLDP